MLTRPGAGPGCAWMKRIVARIPKPGPEREAPPRWWKFYWVAYSIFIIVWFVFMLSVGRYSFSTGRSMGNYESSAHIAGLPLLKVGEAPHAVIAIGKQPRGIVAIGGLPVGIVAIGGLAVGVVCFGGLSAGILALGGGALGWWAMGGGALGYNALGGLALGAYAYAGNGVALGYYEAGGAQKERLLR